VSSRRSLGFTLFELLVVMALMGVLLALVIPVLSAGPAQQARSHGEELLSVLHLLRGRAVAEGLEYGLYFEPGGYQRMARIGGHWRSQEDYPLPDGLHFRLEVEGYASNLVERGGGPQVLILSNDEFSAFSLHYESAQGRWLTLSGDGINDATIHEG